MRPCADWREVKVRGFKHRGHGGTRCKSEFGAEHGDYVISGDDADELAVFVDDGEGDEVIFVEKFGDFVIAGSFVGGEGGPGNEGEQRSILLREYEFGEWDGAGEGAMRVDQVDSADGFDAALEFAQDADGVLDGGGDREREELGGHASSSGFFAVFKKFDNFLAGLGLHLHEDLFGVILRKIGEKVGGGIGIHFLDDVGGALRVERFHDGSLNLGGDIFEGFRGDVFVESAEDSLALVGSEIFDNVGDVGGMKRCEAFVRNFQFNAARRIGFDEANESPGDGAEGNLLQ